MARKISEEIWASIQRAYLSDSPKPTYAELAKQYKISKRSVAQRAGKEKWTSMRRGLDVGLRIGNKPKDTPIPSDDYVGPLRRINPMAALDDAIADLSSEVTRTPCKSKEGAASAMGGLIKLRRDLFPVDADGLAEMAVQLNIRPADFMRALKEKWERDDAARSQTPISINGGQNLEA